MLYPFTFLPIYQERLWGGRNLERLYYRALPPGKVIGESWEIVDRPSNVSVIANGTLKGKDLRWLMEHHFKELLGESQAPNGRFPLLVKILDAQDRLSLQVHPPANVAAELQGEPKTEMWYIADATPDAELYAGLKRGVTRGEFENRIQTGKVADCFHRIPVRPGDAMFLPSGRVHAIGAGNVIFEVQQNSDTTYRVFDWDRVDTQGKPRELHIPQSLQSINFTDFEPELVEKFVGTKARARQLTSNPLFEVYERELQPQAQMEITGGSPRILGVVAGNLLVKFQGADTLFQPGQFCLLPASLARITLQGKSFTRFLEIIPG